MKLLNAVLVFAPVAVFGQTISTPILPPVPVYTALKTYLDLSDTQMQTLQTVQNSRNQATQEIYSQINAKNRTLYSMLNSESGTAAALGQLLLDVHALQKQLPLAASPYKPQALNVLTDAQKAKLPALSQAMQLQTAAWQAISLLLIDAPSVSGPPTPLSAGFTATDPNVIPILVGTAPSDPGPPALPPSGEVTAQIPAPKIR